MEKKKTKPYYHQINSTKIKMVFRSLTNAAKLIFQATSQRGVFSC